MVPITQKNIYDAVKEWCANRVEAEIKYGHISEWDTSKITKMNVLFSCQSYFNDDISKWNVSNVISMQGMFFDAFRFNQPIGDWDVSNVTGMLGMFRNAYKV